MRNPDSWFMSQYASDARPWFYYLTDAGLNRRVKRLRRIAQVTKQRRGCASCGYNKMASGLDFDHKPGHWKIFNLSSPPKIVRISEFKQEMAKCQVLCATCHRETTTKRRGKSRRGDDRWAWFRTVPESKRHGEIARRIEKAMLITVEESEALAERFLALRDVVSAWAASSEEHEEFERLCAAVLAGHGAIGGP